MYPLVKVRGVKYEPGHKNYPQFQHQPGGPLVADPRYPSVDQVYIGWKRVPYPLKEVDHPTKKGVKIQVPDIPADELGRVPQMLDKVSAGAGFNMQHRAIGFMYEYDPTPITVEKTKYISDAISSGDLALVTEEAKDEGKGKGGK